MKIIIWVISVVCISLVLGELYYRYLRKKTSDTSERIRKRITSSMDESIDHHIGELRIESPGEFFIYKPSKRDSYGLAKNNVQSSFRFKKERDEEYKKLL